MTPWPKLFAALALLTALSGCEAISDARTRFGTTDTVAIPGVGSGLMLGLQAPGTLLPGEEGVLRLSVTNQSDTVARNIRLELIVPGWVQPMPPRAGDPEVSMAALPGGNTRFAYNLDETPFEPGETRTIQQRIRVPALGSGSDPEAPLSRTMRARLLGADGQALVEVEASIAPDGEGASDATTTSGTTDARDRIGPARIGMTTAALRQAAPSARDTTWNQEGMPQRGAWVSIGDEGRVLAVLSGDSVTRLEVREAGIRTQERLGVGSTLGELRAAYGAACAGIGEGTVVVWFADAPGVSFALDSPVPANAAQLLSSPDRLLDAARVTRWWVRTDVDACTR